MLQWAANSFVLKLMFCLLKTEFSTIFFKYEFMKQMSLMKVFQDDLLIEWTSICLEILL